MTPELEAARSNRTVIVSVVVAAVAITLFCLVGIAVMLGWVGSKGGAAPPVGIVSSKQQVAGPAPGIDLVPGETLVTPPPAPATPDPPAQPAPTMPSYRKPAKPKAAAPAAPSERTDGVSGTSPRTATEQAPSAPRYVRPGAFPGGPNDTWPNAPACESCGRVTSITTFPGLWEVRVRFDDGASRIVRYPTVPPHRVGDRVRLENGRLERE